MQICNTRSTSKKPILSGNTSCSQKELILEHLQGGKPLTRLEAEMKFSCLSLSQRISELRQHGHKIGSRIIKTETGKRIAEYKLA